MVKPQLATGWLGRTLDKVSCVCTEQSAPTGPEELPPLALAPEGPGAMSLPDITVSVSLHLLEAWVPGSPQDRIAQDICMEFA